MPRSDLRRIDWRGWLALGWAAWFGLLYGEMLLERRAPGVLAALRSMGELKGSGNSSTRGSLESAQQPPPESSAGAVPLGTAARTPGTRRVGFACCE